MMAHLVPVLMAMVLQALTPPPGPRFWREVDYWQWMLRHTGFDESGPNAAPVYAAMNVERDHSGAPVLPFRGPLSRPNEGERVHAWAPEDHPEWEAAWQATIELRKKFVAAAALPFNIPVVVEERRRLSESRLESITGPELWLPRELIKGTLECAWRAENGRIDSAAMEEALQAGLDLSRQCKRTPSQIGMILGVAIETLVCRQARELEKHAQSDRRLRQTLLQILLRQLEQDHSPSYWMCGELAYLYDLEQTLRRDGMGGFIMEEPSTKIVGDGWCPPEFLSPQFLVWFQSLWRDRKKSCDIAAYYCEYVAHQLSRPFDCGTNERITAMYERCRSTDLLLKLLLSDYAGVFRLKRRSATETRATIVLLEIFEHRDREGALPDKLGDLRGDSAAAYLVDPYSNAAFGYRRNGDDFVLYSVSEDARDDGGTTHDPKWGSRIPESDYIFWPVQEP